MQTTTHVPKFRETHRLLSWTIRHSKGIRLPSDREKIFFKDAEKDPARAALAVTRYSAIVGPLDEDLEGLLLCSPVSVMEYAENIGSYPWLKKLPERMHSALMGRPDLVLRLAAHLGQKVGQDMERCLFSQGYEAIIRYAQSVGELDEEMCRFLCSSHSHVLKYASILKNKGLALPRWMMDEMKGDSHSLLHLAIHHLKGRLPTPLEDSVTDPMSLLSYSKQVLHARLPRHLELCLLADHRVACQYAFEVVRGFADVRLADELHSMIVMKSFENPEDMFVKNYVMETERLEKVNDRNS